MGLSPSRLRTARTLKVGINRRYQLPLTPLFNVAHFGSACDAATEKEYKDRKPSELDNSGHAKRNIAIAEIGFIIQDPSNHTQEFISLPVQIPEEPDVYSIGKANQQPHTPPRQRIQEFHAASQKKPTPSRRKSTSPNAIKNPAVFAQLFHHSEQALVTHLNHKKTVKYYLQKLSEKIKDFNPKNITGTVLDLYSTRTICKNCKNTLIGVLSDSSRFMKKLSKKTKKPLIRGCRVIYKKQTKSTGNVSIANPTFNTNPLIFKQHISGLQLPPEGTPPQKTAYTIFSSRDAEDTPKKIKTSVIGAGVLKRKTLFS